MAMSDEITRLLSEAKENRDRYSMFSGTHYVQLPGEELVKAPISWFEVLRSLMTQQCNSRNWRTKGS